MVTMKWFIGKLVFSVTTGNGNHTPQFDEQLRLIEATDLNQAFIKARLIGGREEQAFMSEDLNAVRWQFVDVGDLKELSEFSDGMELYSRIHETENAETHITFIQHCAERIAQQSSSKPIAASSAN